MRNSGHIGVLTQQQSEDAIETQLDNISPIAQDSQNIRPMLWECQQDQKGPPTSNRTQDSHRELT